MKKQKQVYAVVQPKVAGEQPTVHAAGNGRLGEQIIALAKQHGIPVNTDPAMAELLSRLDIEQEIPEDLYPIVNEIVNFASHINDLAEPQN